MVGCSVMMVSQYRLSRGGLVTGIIGILLLAGCTSLCPSPSPSNATKSETSTTETTPTLNAASASKEETPRQPEGEGSQAIPEPTLPVATQDNVITDSELASRVAKLESSPVKSAIPVPAISQPVRKTDAKKVDKPVAPPLDLALLEKRLKETNAIGVFTKLALKNQVNDMLDEFRAYYQGRSNRSLAQLRQPYEMLIMKVLALLQDSDPMLARDLLDSREAIWQVLSDPEKFAAL